MTALRPMQRFGSVIRIKPEKLEEYKRLHAAPWPSVLEILQRVEIRNYSIFSHDGLLFSYFEFHGSSWETAKRELVAQPAMREWWQQTDACQERLPSAKPSEQWSGMDSVFYMP